MKDLTLYGAVKNTSLKYPLRTALYYKGKSITYKQLIDDADKIAGWLYSKGLKKGDVVTVCMPNLPQTVVCFYAINKIGAIAHMVHPLAPARQLEDYVKKTNSKLVILPTILASEHNGLIKSGIKTLLCSPAFYLGKIKNALFSLVNGKSLKKIEKTDALFFYFDAIKSEPLVATDEDAKSTCVYLHSGGTSGEPKTICLSASAINSLCSCSLEMLKEPTFSGGSMLSVLPMFHGFGLAMGVHALLCFGGTDTLMPKFQTKETIKLIKKGKINYLIGVPTLYEALLKRKEFSGKALKSLRQAFVGGDFVPIKLIERFNERMIQSGSSARLYEGYGLTETVTVCAVNTASACKNGTIGKGISSVELAVFKDGKKLAKGEIGELCISGSQLMNGYLGGDNDKVFFKSEGTTWVRSGDMACIDEEGFVHFKSRIKRIAKINGITVFPSEIENLCMNELPKVKEARAIATFDRERGGAIVLFVCTKEEVEGEEKERLTNEINSLIESNLSIFARPKQIFFLRELPKTLIGKVDENKLKQIYL